MTDDEDRAFYAQLGERIRNERKKHNGLSQGKLAKSIGIPRSSLTMIERGQQMVHVRQLLQIARVFGVPYLNLVPEPSVPKARFRGAKRDWFKAVEGSE